MTLEQRFDRIVESEPYMPALDGLRAVSVLLVVTEHVDQSYATGRGYLEHLHGALGVTAFFVLSGFLITLLALREERAKGGVTFSAFYIRRTFRLLPLYYSVLLLYVVLVLVLRLDPRVAEFQRALPYYLLYFQEIPQVFFGETPAPFGISWSLGIEEKFYLLWPVLCFAILTGPWATAKRRALVAAGLGLGLLLVPWAAGMNEAVLIIPEGYGAILLGCLVAIAVFEPSWRGALLNWARWWVPFAAMAAVIATAGDHRGTAIATAIALPAVLVGAGPIGRLLGARPLVWIGRRSYGIYLTHLFGLNAARRVLGGRLNGVYVEAGVYLLGLALTLCAVAVIYRVLEKPMIDYGRRLASRTGRDKSVV